MRYERRGLLATGLAGLVMLPLLTVQGFAQSASTTRLRGVIAGMKGDALMVTTSAGKTVTVGIDPQTRVTTVGAASLADIKPGDFVGSAARLGPDGVLVALEVHIFPENLRGMGEGHRPMDIGPQTSMTNGTVGSDVASVSGVSGRFITVRYGGGEQRIRVPDDAPVVTFDVGTQAMLTPGAHVSIVASEAADGALRATRISVGKNGVTPPL